MLRDQVKMFIDLGDEEKVEVEELWAISECIVCNKNLTLKHELRRSKLLPCLHAMCYRCFIKCCGKGEIVCHYCSFSFNKDEIYDNKVLYEIVSDVDIPKTKNLMCSIHNTKVTHWCENCNEFICPDCVKHHGQLKSTRSHTIITKDSYVCKLLTGTPKTAFPCEVHPENELSIICHSCRAMTCRDCQLEHHKDHKYDFIVDKADGAKNELYSVFKKVEFHSLIMTAALSKITEREAKIEELKKKIVSDIKKEFDLIEEMIKKRANELMLSAVEKANLKLDECEQNRKLLKRNLNSIQHCLKFVKCVLFTSSDPVLYYTKDLMLNRMSALHFVNRVPCAVDVINLSFSPENIADTKAKIEKCGAILECQDPATRDKNYWSSIYTAIYSEFMDRYKVLEGKKCEERHIGLTGDIEVTSDTQKSNQVSYAPEKAVELPQKSLSSVLRQDESSKEKLQSTVRDPRAASDSLTMQNRPANNITLDSSLLTSSSEQQKSVPVQSNHDNQKAQSKVPLPWSNFSQAKSWHIPETVKLTPKPVTESDMGNGIKKVRIPAQNPVIDLTDQNFPDYEALDEILKDLGAIEERENRERESSQEQSPTGLSHDSWCSVCLGHNGYISCNSCPKGFHQNCHIPPITFPVPPHWTCILCQEIRPLPPGNYSHFRATDLKIANRLLLEMYCQVEESTPFRSPGRNSSCMRSICLPDIKVNLEKGRYTGIMDFIRDIKTMFNNCYRSRQGDVDVVGHAKSLEEIFNRLLSKFIPHLTFQTQ